MVDDKTIKQGVVGIVFLAIFLLAFLVLKEIIIPIIFGLLFAYIFTPVYRKLYVATRLKSVSAFLLIVGVGAIFVLPLVYFTPNLVEQIFDTFKLLQNFNFNEYFGLYFDSELANSFALNLRNIIGQMFSTLLNQFKELLINLPNIMLQFAVFLFTFFFAVRDSEKLMTYVSSLSPLSKSTEKKFLKEFRGITNAIIFGQVLIGIIQGLAVGIALFLLGIPKALILTFVAMIFSMIPLLGSWVVWLPVGILQIVSGNSFAGIFLLFYGALFVSSIDNFVRPYILAKQSNLPVALSIIGVIGGLYLFGISGLVLGPLILAYVLIIIEFYREGNLSDLFKKEHK
jgi:predicted PurR-regulated permease PerM